MTGFDIQTRLTEIGRLTLNRIAIIAATSVSWPVFRRVALALVVISLYAVVPQSLEVLAQNRKIVSAQQAFIEWSQRLPETTTISMTDMGRIPFCTGLHYYDLWGLVDEETAHNGQDVPREILRLPDYFVLIGYLGPDECSLEFGHERKIAWTNYFSPCYKYLTVCTPDGVSPFEPGYNYLIFKRTPQARMLLRH